MSLLKCEILKGKRSTCWCVAVPNVCHFRHVLKLLEDTIESKGIDCKPR